MGDVRGSTGRTEREIMGSSLLQHGSAGYLSGYFSKIWVPF